MNRILTGILALALLQALTGCATYEYRFTDEAAEGINPATMTMSEFVLFAKRELATSSASYEWTGEGPGKWTVGGDSLNSDSTDALETVNLLFKTLLEALKAYTATIAPIP